MKQPVFYFGENKKNQKVITAVIEHKGRFFSGKATCANDDTYNEETGKRVAELKAMIKVDAAKVHRLNSRAKVYYDIAANLENQADGLIQTAEDIHIPKMLEKMTEIYNLTGYEMEMEI